MMKHFAALAAASLGVAGPASARVAVQTCAEHGYPVNAFVVDTSGLVIVQLRGDHATVHTKDSAFRKAYTVVTMGPIFGLDRTSEFRPAHRQISERHRGAARQRAQCRRPSRRRRYQARF